MQPRWKRGCWSSPSYPARQAGSRRCPGPGQRHPQARTLPHVLPAGSSQPRMGVAAAWPCGSLRWQTSPPARCGQGVQQAGYTASRALGARAASSAAARSPHHGQRMLLASAHTTWAAHRQPLRRQQQQQQQQRQWQQHSQQQLQLLSHYWCPGSPTRSHACRPGRRVPGTGCRRHPATAAHRSLRMSSPSRPSTLCTPTALHS